MLKISTPKMTEPRRKKAEKVINQIVTTRMIASKSDLDQVISLLAGYSEKKTAEENTTVNNEETSLEQNSKTSDKDVFRIIEELRLFRRRLEIENINQKIRR